MKKAIFGPPAAVMVALACTSPAQAVTIDFDDLPYGTAVTNQFPDVTFSLSGPTVGSATPVTNGPGPDDGLYDSPTATYPTSEFLHATFGSPVSGVAFTFDTYGYNGLNAYTVHTVGGATSKHSLHTGAFTLASNLEVSSIEFNNGLGASSNNWSQVLETLSYNESAPELAPGTAALPAALALGGLALAGSYRRKKLGESTEQ